MAQTDRLDLPLIAAGQAQKEVMHNEALTRLDLLVQAIVESADLSTPPASPSPGDCWIVASGGSGDWADQDGALAGWTASGWVFAVPRAGWRAWAIDRAGAVLFDGTDWIDAPARADGFYVDDERVVGARQAAITSPAGGSVEDVEGRYAINTILTVLRSHGLIAT